VWWLVGGFAAFVLLIVLGAIVVVGGKLLH
jgi:hypothetical protein